ncbi:hypothetical protein [Hyphococcus luteus]|uniref:DUF4142 domain-containing protein n=1 Tax=Hyphococcus luteus TaxID=2058213 RepID=A0A2S7JYQ3_9PROT|nr:hypothetical protein [Marinicaulis flavus]PQA85370.1 hypothetical protein CW354_20690 [Marinicaulis flavus]
MNNFKQILLVLMAMGAAACSGGEEAGADAKTVNAENADSASEAVEVYSVHLTRIADALEAVESEAGAQTAAQVIADATNEFEILAEKFNEANKMQLTAAMAARANDLTKPQMRIGMAMQTLTSEHPEYLETISEAMDEMPPLQ